MAAKKVAILIGSTRVVRIGPQVADFVHQTLLASPTTPKAELSVIDLKDFNLPVFDEKAVPATVPAMAQFELEHTKKWTAAITAPDAYIFVTPEYNFSIPGGLKNAIDYLYTGFVGKPVLIVSYGAKGGQFASQDLSDIFERMKLQVVEPRPQFAFAAMEDAYSAGAGTLGESSLNQWKQNTGDLLKAYEQLVELANTPPKAE
ncbi:flavoprotein-like protein [Xylogone sp. PMI_703]|nr:flavoprotein-like protein [Xylogone sp. PMI_703]